MTPRHRPLTAAQRRHRRLYPLLLAVAAGTGFALPVQHPHPQPSTCVAPLCDPATSIATYERQP